MSGHSKWASIKHQKAIKDARRGAAFTKYANMITVAAKAGADPETNFRLRLAVAKAKQAGVPLANIERAIKKGTGSEGGAALEEITYEGYGPGGVAIMATTATDNRNRTASDVRSAFTKYGGSLGTSGSVAYQFSQRGLITLASSDLEQAMLDAIEAGAEDVEEVDNQLNIYTSAQRLDEVRRLLTSKGYDICAAELSFEPNSIVSIKETKTAQTLMRLLDALDELDDVTETYSNADFDAEVFDQL